MSVAMAQANTDPMQALLRFLNSEQFYALGTTLLLHLIVAVILLAGWVGNQPAEPMTKAIKVQMFVMPAAEKMPQVATQTHVEAKQAAQMPAPPQKEIAKNVVVEAPFAKKRVEETPKINAEKLTEPTPQVSQQASVDTTEKTEKTEKTEINTELKSAVNSEANKSDANSERSENAPASSAEKNFDISQYAPVKKDAPVYPQRALDKSVQGTCTVQYMVNTQGLVENPVALSDCHAFFIKPSLEATKSFRYSPRIVDGKAVNVSNVKNTFQYRIE